MPPKASISIIKSSLPFIILFLSLFQLYTQYTSFVTPRDHKLNEIDHVENRDFWKAMLIRKRAKDKSVERNTPLFELIWKVNWRYENDWHIEFTRPNYYNLISNSMDFSLKLLNENITPRRIETDWIVDFITKKDEVNMRNK